MVRYGGVGSRKNSTPTYGGGQYGRPTDRRVLMSEFQRWESRFAVPEYIFGTEANAFLRAHKHLLPKEGRALAIADGEGRNGVWLAEQGLDVLSIDFSPAAQAKARALAQARGVRIAIELIAIDRYHWPEQAFDAVVDIFTQFSDPAERAEKFAGIRTSLKAGGLLLLQGYRPSSSPMGPAVHRMRRTCTRASCWNGNSLISSASRSSNSTPRSTRAPPMAGCRP